MDLTEYPKENVVWTEDPEEHRFRCKVTGLMISRGPFFVALVPFHETTKRY